MKIGIINYGGGNIKSVCNLLDRLKVDYIFSDQVEELEKVDKLIFPGQGRAGPAMDVLNKSGLSSFIKSTKKPFLGICLGMQLLMDFSEEDNCECLGIMLGMVKRFSNASKLPIPQIGWNKVWQVEDSPLFKGIASGSYFYFVNSYFVDSQGQFCLGQTNYTRTFESIVQKDNYIGVQFHPEKSGDMGERLIKNFLNLDKSELFGQSIKSNLAKRVIACMDIKDGRVVKGRGYKDLVDAGDPVELAKFYAAQGADELVFLDINATADGRDTLYDLVESVAKGVNIPFCVGGGVRTIGDIEKLLSSGADKVSIGSAAVKNPDLVREAVEMFGSQCIVISVDAKKVGTNWHQFLNGGRVDSGQDAIKFAVEMEMLGAGELLVNSLDRDGSGSGYDLELLKSIKSKVSISVIASSGAGKLSDFEDAVQIANVDAVLAAGVFHRGEIAIRDVKQVLGNKTLPASRSLAPLSNFREGRGELYKLM